jgi:hypothetical protein
MSSVPMNWTISPQFTAGYRLPSGFGEFLMSYRFFNTQGTSLIPTANTGLGGATALETSRLSLNQLDLDYSSREYTPYPRVGVRWWVGMRLLDFYYASAAAASAAPFGSIDQVQATDQIPAIGGHAGLELDWALRYAGLMVVNKVDFAGFGAKTNQNFSASSSTLGTGASVRDSRGTGAPYVNWQLGIAWQPPQFPCARFFMGGQMEYWWGIGDNYNDLARFSVGSNGIVWQAALNF